MEIKDQDYSVIFSKANATISFTGSIRLQNLPAYETIKTLLRDAYSEVGGSLLALDMKDLNFVNSSGITTLSMFIIDSRKKEGGAKIKVIGNNTVSWQIKSLANFQKLWDSVQIEMVG